MTTTIARYVLIPLLLLGVVLYQLTVGGNSLPGWLNTVSIRMEVGSTTMLRWLVVLECALLVTCMTLRRPGLFACWITLVGTGFVSLAECAASVRSDATRSLVASGTILLISLVIAFMLGRSNREHGDRTTEPPPRARWSTSRAVALVAGLLIAISVGLNIPLAERTIADGRALVPQQVEVPGDVPIFTLAPENWSGRMISEIEITTYVPELVRLTSEGRSLVVVYNKGCGNCHEIFDVHFGDGFHIPVIAVEVPPADGAMLSESRREDDVNCLGCTMTSLPQGPMWLVRPPVVMVIEDGRILCAETEAHLACIEEA